MSPVDDILFEQSPDADCLIVFFHAYTGSPEGLESVRRVARERFPNADFLTPRLPLSALSCVPPRTLVDGLVALIDQVWTEHRYKRILLVGHSLGALLTRAVYVEACRPQDPDTAGPPVPSFVWARKVERIVLLAGVNRGWRVSHQISIKHAFLLIPGVWICRFLMLLGIKPLIMEGRRGSVLITKLRIDWIRMHARATKWRGNSYPGDATVIQLLGSVDDLVSPEDDVDLVAGRDFIYMDVPYSAHDTVVDMDDRTPVPADPQGRTVGQGRAAVLAKALTAPEAVLRAENDLPSDRPPAREDMDVTHVLFVIHGIRDNGYWTHKVARKALDIAKARNDAGAKRKPYKIATVTASYGYFPILSFLSPNARREKVEWLMDRYAEALALYPDADFCYVGHSNGTYLLAKALEDYPSVQFKNVVFAGSVVHSMYRWAAGQGSAAGRVADKVERVLNFTATADWVVAFFPAGFQQLGLSDLGSAGFRGFRAASRPHGLVIEKRYAGQHGAALVEQNWETIATFALDGKVASFPPSLVRDDQQKNALVRLIGTAPVVLWAVVAVLLVLLGAYFWTLDLPEWARTLILTGYVWVIVKLARTV